MAVRKKRGAKAAVAFSVVVTVLCWSCAPRQPVGGPQPQSGTSPAYALSRDGDLRLTLAPGWRPASTESFGGSPILALEHQSGSSVILAVSENAGTKTLDELVLARRDYIASLALATSLKIYERRYFFDVDQLVPCSLATYEYLAAGNGDRMVQLVLTVVADRRAYEILGLTAGRKEAAEEALKPVISSLVLVRAVENPS